MSFDFDAFFEKLDARQIKAVRNFALDKSNTFHIGGVCAVAVFPRTELELCDAARLAKEYRLPVVVIGKGSNCLFYDGFIEKVIIFTRDLCDVTIDGAEALVKCGAGVSLVALSRMAADAGLGGLEFACGIPGSVGGALFMNAGAHGAAMADVVVSSLAYDRESREVLHITDHGFGYRKSVYMENKNLVCLGATLRLTAGNSDDIKHKIKELLAQRREKQPLEFASAGSYFKRPEGDFAGRLIELCGLKGFAVGDAQVSQKHAGFVINRGGATFDDVMRLEDHIVKTVYEQTGVTLQREVEIIR